MNRVVFINAAPHAGKDSLSNHLASQIPCVQAKFASTIRRALYAHYAMSPEEVEWFEAHKDERHPMFNGHSWRDELIHYSESYIKPRHGLRHFGLIAARDARRLNMHGRLLVYSDAGFTSEEQAFIEDYHSDAKYLVIRVDRPGCKWDSRHRLNEDDFDHYGERVLFTDIHNDSTLSYYLTEGLSSVRDWMNLIG